MQCMVTITHNDHVPEPLAVIRRKPFAEPTETEMVEYLFTRVPAKETRKELERHALEHVAALAVVQLQRGVPSVASALLRC